MGGHGTTLRPWLPSRKEAGQGGDLSLSSPKLSFSPPSLLSLSWRVASRVRVVRLRSRRRERRPWAFLEFLTAPARTRIVASILGPSRRTGARPREACGPGRGSGGGRLLLPDIGSDPWRACIARSCAACSPRLRARSVDLFLALHLNLEELRANVAARCRHHVQKRRRSPPSCTPAFGSRLAITTEADAVAQVLHGP